jgi:hypothetical protein
MLSELLLGFVLINPFSSWKHGNERVVNNDGFICLDLKGMHTNSMVSVGVSENPDRIPEHEREENRHIQFKYIDDA